MSGAGGSAVPRGGNSEQEVESFVGGALTPTKTSSSSPPPPTKVVFKQSTFWLALTRASLPRIPALADS